MNTAVGVVVEAERNGDTLLEGLRDAEVFEGLSALQLARLCFASKVRRHSSDYKLVREGDAPAGLFVVVDGEYAVTRGDAGTDETPLEVFGRGDCFGECAMVDGAPSPGQVIATRDSMVIEISASRLHCTLRDDDGLASLVYQNLLRIVVRRLRGAVSQLSAAPDSSPAL